MLGDGGLPSHDTRRWGSNPHLRHSLERLARILDYLDRNDIRMYRLPTGLAPYASIRTCRSSNVRSRSARASWLRSGRLHATMLEAKGKDVALLTLRAQLNARGVGSRAGRLMVDGQDGGAPGTGEREP